MRWTMVLVKTLDNKCVQLKVKFEIIMQPSGLGRKDFRTSSNWLEGENVSISNIDGPS